jgi:hypothetical protein
VVAAGVAVDCRTRLRRPVPTEELGYYIGGAVSFVPVSAECGSVEALWREAVTVRAGWSEWLATGMHMAVAWLMSHTKFRYFVYLVVAMGVGVIFFTQHEGKTFLESLYWVVITGLAVGFGDLYPSDQPGQIFTFFYMLLLVPITYALISLMVRREQPVAEVLGRSLSLEMFEFFDRDGDGQVTKDEYLGTILVMLEKTDFETVRGSFCYGQ